MIKIDYKEVIKRERVVKWFGKVKLTKLLENAHKGTWQEMTIEQWVEAVTNDLRCSREVAGFNGVRQCP